MRSLALGAILVGIVSVVAALTLLPAVLAAARRPRQRAARARISAGGSTSPSRARAASGARSSRRVIRRPALSLAARRGRPARRSPLPVLGLNIGAAGISTLPDDLPSKQGFLALQRSFPAASADPAVVVIDGAASAPESRRAIAALQRAPGRRSPLRPLVAAGEPGRRPRRAQRPARRRRARATGPSRPCATCAPTTSRPRSRAADATVLVDRHHGREHRLLRRHEPLAAARARVRAGPELRAADRRVPLGRHRRHRDRAQPALRRRRLRPARARLPEGRRRRPARLPAGRRDRGVGTAVPLRRPVRAVDGLPGVPAQPHPRALLRRRATRPTRSRSGSARRRASSRARR